MVGFIPRHASPTQQERQLCWYKYSIWLKKNNNKWSAIIIIIIVYYTPFMFLPFTSTSTSKKTWEQSLEKVERATFEEKKLRKNFITCTVYIWKLLNRLNIMSFDGPIFLKCVWYVLTPHCTCNINDILMNSTCVIHTVHFPF